MLTSLHIENFKGFKNTKIPELRKVNLILGSQNAGKTSLLEAVVFATGSIEDKNNSGAIGRLPQMFRPCEGEGDALRFWKSIIGTDKNQINFYAETSYKRKSSHKDNDDIIDSRSISIHKKNWKQKQAKESILILNEINSLRIYIEQNPIFSIPKINTTPKPFPAFSTKSAEQVELYGRLVTGRKKKEIIRLLKNIEPRLESIDAVAPDGEHRIYVELSNDDVLRPLSQLGHGFTRLFELYAGLAVTESKLALIDEIENGIHYSALPILFQGVRELAESNGVQSLITTHSLECIKSAYEVFQDKLEDFQLIRLERTEDGNVRAIAINDENLKTIMESGWEIR